MPISAEIATTPIEEGHSRASERRRRLRRSVANRSTYEYDFGDDWRHAVTSEGTDQLRKGERALACLAGERRCSPEDCGGVYGYAELLDILTNPRHEGHQSMLGGLVDRTISKPSRQRP